ncbi:MAG: elongation factor Ts, partial [Bacilli bacterium]|nr:elongation factor Ts [Bacilli bacterium]
LVMVDGNNAVIVELNCETDFVSANEKFTNLLDKIAKTVINSDAKTVEEALELKTDEGTLNDDIINVTATMGEKISFRRFTKLTKSDNEVFGKYIHMGGKISALCLVEGTDENVANDVAMHLAAMNPKYVDRDSVPGSVIEEESKVLKEQAVNEGKPEEIAEKMVQGRINKYYKDIVITEQDFVKNPDITVGTYLKNNNCTLKEMVRFEVGEGIEKKEENFAEEVAKQING